jgi:hypothetical protein
MTNEELKLLKELRCGQHKCIHCGKDLVDGYDNESCKSCRRLLHKAMNDGGWRAKLTVKILDHYGWKCSCCGCDIPEFLTVDHCFGAGNEHRRDARKMGSNDWYKTIIAENYPDKYQILCYNCNLGRQRNNGICPHKLEQ